MPKSDIYFTVRCTPDERERMRRAIQETSGLMDAPAWETILKSVELMRDKLVKELYQKIS